MKKYIYLFICMACCSQIQAQERLKLNLQQTISLANDSSLEAFRTQNMY